MKTTYSAAIHIFPGTYNTLFSPEIDTVLSEYETINLPQYLDELGLEYCRNLSDYLPNKIEIDRDITYTGHNSPREYNFSTDRLFADISCQLLADLQQYATLHLEEFKSYLKERYTSYDGFMSHYSADAEDRLCEGEKLDHNLVGDLLCFAVSHSYDLGNKDGDLQHELYDGCDTYQAIYNLTEVFNSNLLNVCYLAIDNGVTGVMIDDDIYDICDLVEASRLSSCYDPQDYEKLFDYILSNHHGSMVMIYGQLISAVSYSQG
jgi:hypothetical protein